MGKQTCLFSFHFSNPPFTFELCSVIELHLSAFLCRSMSHVNFLQIFMVALCLCFSRKLMRDTCPSPYKL